MVRSGFFAALTIFTWMFAASAGAVQASVASCSHAEADGGRTLCHQTVLDASVSEVWSFWTTADGLRSWAAPVIAIEARPGGVWEASYNRFARIGDAGNIRNRIIAVQRNALLIMQVAAAPPGFAYPNEVRDLLTVIELEPVDASHTRVRISMRGYRQSGAFDQLYRFFEWGNAYSLLKLQQRIANGPVDWSAEAAQATTPETR